MRALLIDPEPESRAILARSLLARGHELVERAGEREALSACRAGSFPLIVIGAAPSLDVPGLCRQIRWLPNGDVCVILVATHAGHHAWLAELLDAGASDWLARPLDADELTLRLAVAERFAQDAAERKQMEQALRMSEERHELVVRGAHDTLYDWNVETGALYLSPAWEDLTGEREPDPARGAAALVDRIHPGDLPALAEEVRRHVAGETSAFGAEARLRHADGAWHWIVTRGIALKDEQGLPVRIAGSLRDVTLRKRAEEALRNSEQRFRSLIQNALDVIAVVDEAGVIRYASPSIERVLGWREAELGQKPLLDRVHPEDRQRFGAALDRARAGGEPPRIEVRLRHESGAYCHIETIADKLEGWAGGDAIVLNCRDVTERLRLHEQLERQAFFDPVTGLPNRLLFFDRLEHALAHAERRSDAVAVLFVDLDGFKSINDRFGHERGDDALAAVGRRLQAAMRKGDTVARLGGDEFTVVAWPLERRRDAIQLAERILAEVRRPIDLDGHEVTVTASIGIAFCDPRGTSPQELVRQADHAMYRAKALGKNQYLIWDPRLEAASGSDTLPGFEP